MAARAPQSVDKRGPRTPARKLPAEVGAGEEEDDDQAGQEEEDDGEGDARVVVVEEVREQVPVAEDGEG